jgi:hypothetical protein
MACCQYRPAAVRKPDYATHSALAPRPAALPPACGPAHRRVRGILCPALLAVAALAFGGVAACAEETAPPSDARPLTRLLPQTRNHKVCFTARLDDARIDLVTSDQRAKQAPRRVEALAVELYWDDAEPMDYADGWGYDRRYELMLAARVGGYSKPLVGGMECEYRDRALIDPKTGKIIEGPTATRLACSQDCDGGSLSLEADAGDKTPTLVFTQPQWARVDGGELRPATSVTRVRLEPAAPSACQSIEEATD